MRMAGLYTLIAFCVVSACAFPGVLSGEEGIGLEGIEWRLGEVGGVPVSLPADEKQPHITFDPAKKKATGYSGCNSFFAGYERDGAKLKFGPIGSTRRACPDPKTALEGVFFSALADTLGWNITDGRLLLTWGLN